MYAYLNLLCVLILSYILFRMRSSPYLSTNVQRFTSVVGNVIALLTLDALAGLVSGNCYPVSIVVNAAFLSFVGVTAYSWFHYIEVVLGLPEPPRWRRIVYVVPAAIAVVLSVSSIWTGWVFTVDPATVLYHRGPWHSAQLALSAIYLVFSIFLILREMHGNAASDARRQELASLLALVAFPAIGAVLDALIYGIPFTWTLSSVGIVVVFVNSQHYSISTDPLTGLNNRRHFETRARALVEDAGEDDHVYLLLIDVNDFKAINDTYGHRTGDVALVTVADLLKHAVGEGRLVIARYGGDEFAIIGRLQGPEEAERLRQRIVDAFDRRNEATPEGSYRLTLSIGIAEAGKAGIKTVDDLVNAADERLYAAKGRKVNTRA